MKRFLITALVTTAVTIVSHCHAQELKKISLDDSSQLGLKLETDAKVKVEGAASLKITTAWPTVVCLGEVTGLDVENCKVVFKAKVKTELAEKGTAFLEMWCHVDGGQYFSKGMDSVVTGKEDWKEIKTPFLLKTGQKSKKITLNLVINGTGTVWVDDIVLSKEPLPEVKP